MCRIKALKALSKREFWFKVKTSKLLEAISKIGFWCKVKAGLSFNPQEYISILRT